MTGPQFDVSLVMLFYSEKNAVHVVNKALDEEDSAGTFQALQNPKLNLPNLLPSAQLLYHEELKCMKAEKQVRFLGWFPSI